jgi:inositol hexakisphosphate/diphosphoinositol-pentakisphosphate kinase
LTQITFELYERSAGSPEGVAEFSLRIGFSPGAHDPNLIELQLDSKDSMSVQPRKWLTDHLPLDEAIKLLKPADAFK